MITPQPVPWLKKWVNHISPLLEPKDHAGLVGCHYCLVDGCWEITLFFSATEVIGGKRDGLIRQNPFVLDLKALCTVGFDQIDLMEWQSCAFTENKTEDEFGAHFAIQGSVDNNNILLRICAEMPACFTPGQQVDAQGNQLSRVW